MKTRHTFGIILSSDSFSSDLFQVKYSPDLGISYHGVERSNITYSRYFLNLYQVFNWPNTKRHHCIDALEINNDHREKSLWEIKDATDPSVSGMNNVDQTSPTPG